jgi:hypothetical protein
MTPERIAELRALCSKPPMSLWGDELIRNYRDIQRALLEALDEINKLRGEAAK